MSIPSTQHLSPVSLALREVAAESPGKVALEIDEQRVTYGQLNEQADRLAHRLVTELGPADQRIALRANGTHALSVGFLGIQRAGMVAVGIDPTAPPERVGAILDDVEPAIVLSDVPDDGEPGFPVPVFDVSTFGSEADPVPTDRERGELASIVYTSGSTGRPKGIMMGHGQTSALLLREGDYQLEEGWRLGSMVAGTVAHAELIASTIVLLRGTLVAYEIRRHGVAPLGAWLQTSELDCCYLVPTILRHVLPTIGPGTKLHSVRKVFLSGETATWDDVTRLRRILDQDAVIVNAFGQSETGSIASIAIPSDVPAGEGRLPAGRPHAEMNVTIVGADGQPVPTGERGEIVVRSQHVSLGYWRRPELTRATYFELADGVRQVMTGDEGRLLTDGTLQHLGRLDHLVKISGNRVELGEVEAALVALNGVEGAAASAFTDDTENTRLAACVIPESGAVLDPRVLRVSLARRLPGYMVPTRIAVAESLPCLPGGKLDRGAVAKMPLLDHVRSGSSSAPANRLERQLQEIWRELLPLDQIDRDDDFFALGGDSIRAARMFVEIERRLGIDQPVSLLAEAPTIASLAAVLNDSESPWSAPLAVRMQGTRAPLFVIHDGVGSVLYARGLARALGTDQPLYGIRCETLNGEAPKERSLVQMAARYAEQIRGLYRDGPYVLYGVSLGGVIALEVARQLLEGGAQVPLVVLGDSAAPVVPDRGEFDFHRRTTQSLSPAERLRYVARVAAQKLGWLFSEEGWTERGKNRQLDLALRRGEAIPPAVRDRWVIREFGRLAATHQMRPPFPARTLLLRAHGPGQDSDHGWRELLGHSLHIADVPLRHNDLGREASGVHVGPVIRVELDRLALDARSVAPAAVAPA